MRKKSLFKQKSNYFTLLNFLIITLLFFCILFYFFQYKSKKYFVILDNLQEYYIIPSDRGGEKVKNINKKILHLNQKEETNSLFNDTSKLNYSIQLFASSNYAEVKDRLSKYIAKTDYIYKKEDFFTIILSTDIGSEYLLLYKNFNDRKEALNHCHKYLFQLDKCLIVNTKLFNN